MGVDDAHSREMIDTGDESVSIITSVAGWDLRFVGFGIMAVLAAGIVVPKRSLLISALVLSIGDFGILLVYTLETWRHNWTVGIGMFFFAVLLLVEVLAIRHLRMERS